MGVMRRASPEAEATVADLLVWAEAEAEAATESAKRHPWRRIVEAAEDLLALEAAEAPPEIAVAGLTWAEPEPRALRTAWWHRLFFWR